MISFLICVAVGGFVFGVTGVAVAITAERAATAITRRRDADLIGSQQAKRHIAALESEIADLKPNPATHDPVTGRFVSSKFNSGTVKTG